MYLVKSPLLLKWYYPTLIWNKSRSEKVVYLTFDDGPIPNVTAFVLNTLKSYNIKATFFCIGDNIRKYPEIFTQIKTDGHTVGNHTFNHFNGWKTNDKAYLNNFDKCQSYTKSAYFRPPYGRIKKSQIAQLKSQNPNLKIIMWDVLSGDFDLKLSPKKCYNNVIKNTKNGSIIVFHDSEKAFERLKYALPKSIEELLKQGFKFEPL